MITEYDDASHLAYILYVHDGYIHALSLGMISPEHYALLYNIPYLPFIFNEPAALLSP